MIRSMHALAVAALLAQFVSSHGPVPIAPAATPATKSGYALHGAMAEGPNGAVFFKLTGPRRSVVAAGRDFDALVASLRP